MRTHPVIHEIVSRTAYKYDFDEIFDLTAGVYFHFHRADWCHLLGCCVCACVTVRLRFCIRYGSDDAAYKQNVVVVAVVHVVVLILVVLLFLVVVVVVGGGGRWWSCISNITVAHCHSLACGHEKTVLVVFQFTGSY